MIYIARDCIQEIWPNSPCNTRTPKTSIEKLDDFETVNLAVLEVLPMVFEFNRHIGIANKEARLHWLRNRWSEPISQLPRIRINTNLTPQFSCALAPFRIVGADHFKVRRLMLDKYKMRTMSYREEYDPPQGGLNAALSLVNSPQDAHRLVEVIADVVLARRCLK